MEKAQKGLSSFHVGCADLMTRSLRSLRLQGIGLATDRKETANTSSSCESAPCPAEKKSSTSVVDVEHGCFIRFFYPTTDVNGRKRAPWLPSTLYSKHLLNFMNVPTGISGIFHWFYGRSLTQAYTDAKLLDIEQAQDAVKGESNSYQPKVFCKGKFPVVIFSHGRGSNRNMYSSLCCYLASKGCLVASLEHRDESASLTYTIENGKETFIPYRKILAGESEFEITNKQVDIRTKEVLSTLNVLKRLDDVLVKETSKELENLMESDFDFRSLKGKLDFENIALVGHSFGGATVINTLAESSIFRCGVCFDVWMFPVSKEKFKLVKDPIVFINSESFHWKRNIKSIKELNSFASQVDRPMVTVLGTNHYSHADVPLMISPLVLRAVGIASDLDAQRAMDLQNKVMWEFLCKYLDFDDSDNGDPAVLVGGDSCPAEIMIGTNVSLDG